MMPPTSFSVTERLLSELSLHDTSHRNGLSADRPALSFNKYQIATAIGTTACPLNHHTQALTDHADECLESFSARRTM
jgi:hypothetical protein